MIRYLCNYWVISTEWHPDFGVPTKVTEPTRIIEYTYDAQGNQTSKTIRGIQ
ncbi:MAG: hypothetical protein JMN25_18265 [gamma proteobacterium endosymbiont of Lamellibrachia anaximandri]|nr:hypothetical protein [gamma proteobacterium endosymbiont of Lamellibrachia anaximandri]